jgi:DNA repair exonuclease SbcCD nuclease subunit
MNYLVIGDPHVTHKSMDRIAVLFDMIEDFGMPVIILGDLFDTKEIIRGKCFNYVYKRLKASRQQFTILVGNHDWFNLDCQEHSLEALKELDNVTIVDEPKMSMGMLFVPYYDDLNKFYEAVNNPIFDSAKTLFMHQGVIGFDYGNGFIADGNGHGEITSDKIRPFKKIISGHFHKFAESDNLMFLGTPFSHTFGETDQVKYIGVFDPDYQTIELMETPFPRHRTLEIDLSEENPKKLLKSLLNEKDIFRCKLIGTEMQIKAFDQSGFQGVRFNEESTDSEQAEDVALKETDSNEQKFMTWAKDIKDLDEDTIKLGLDILGGSK